MLPANPVDFDWNLVWRCADGPCSGAHSACGANPLLQKDSLAAFDGHLQSGSPAINAGTTAGAPSTDLEGHKRDAQPDIGCYEYQGTHGQLLFGAKNGIAWFGKERARNSPGSGLRSRIQGGIGADRH